MKKLISVLFVLSLLLFGCEDDGKVKDGTQYDDGVVMVQNEMMYM